MHEAAHGWVAWKLGDDTAKVQGRVTFNPLAHIDPFGTVLLPLLLLVMQVPFLFGYAKPVPVNFQRLKNPRTDMVWVALAGPGANILLALTGGLLLNLYGFLPEFMAEWFGRNLVNLILINAILAVFNMLPLPPLDGGRVAVGLLPAGLARPLARLEPYGMMILIGLIFVLPMIGAQLGLNFNLVFAIIKPLAEFIESLAHSLFILRG
ncbi:site-2 protease family protein [Emcibacter sp.]|uniref:site-2 protease family protein n=1 Tax=Emcibacter sp. TaxID=1979954 RepID=UPI003B63E681